MASLCVAIPTRGRSDYLETALASITGQANAAHDEVLVVLDGPDPAAAAVAERYGAAVFALPAPQGANAARNAALAASDAEVIVFCDDDIEAPAGWLDAYRTGLEAYPDHAVFGGPITARLEGGPRHCGREPAPITTLAGAAADHDVTYVWSANMAVRRSAVQAVGGFDERLHGRGEEEEWLDRVAAAGLGVRLLAGAGLVHRRHGADARLRSLARADFSLGASARVNDVRTGRAPTLTRELRGFAGALWHTLRRRCGYGPVFAAHALGRIRETLSPTPLPAPEGDFLSGESGYVAGTRAILGARAADAHADLASSWARRRLARDAAAWGPVRRVQVLGLERDDVENILDPALEELRRSRHDVRVARSAVAGRGRFENLNRLLERSDVDLSAADWLIVIDDDVALPPGFLDGFLFLAERHGLTLAQPAHRHFSHAAWRVTRRRRASALRETGFVEIGPLVAFHRDSFADLLPFPSLRVGWGVDAHWAAVAQARGWRIGVVDLTPIAHRLRPIADSYSGSAALAESRRFLASHAHISPTDANRTLRTHPRW